jgi:hypothetical protein
MLPETVEGTPVDLAAQTHIEPYLRCNELARYEDAAGAQLLHALPRASPSLPPTAKAEEAGERTPSGRRLPPRARRRTAALRRNRRYVAADPAGSRAGQVADSTATRRRRRAHRGRTPPIRTVQDALPPAEPPLCYPRRPTGSGGGAVAVADVRGDEHQTCAFGDESRGPLSPGRHLERAVFSAP